MRHTFAELLDLAAAESGGRDSGTRPAIVKEFLHYDILHALAGSDIARRVAFQGGTALRLAYGGQRYSEDLDFVCGADVSEPFLLDGMTAILARHVQERYGLDIEVHPPGPGKTFDRDGVTVKRWRYAVKVPGFSTSQRIHVEFCNVPAYDAAPLLLQPRYGFLDDYYGGIVINTESETEILADKLVALAGRRHLKARDVWDIRWLTQRGNRVNVDWVRRKAQDYGIADLPVRLGEAMDRLRHPEACRGFVEEMQRFVAPPIVAAMLRELPAGKSWLEHAARIADDVRQRLARE